MNKAYLIDAGERVFWTLVQAAGGAVIDLYVSGEITWKSALYAAGLAIVKVAAARKIGDSNTAQAAPGVESTYVSNQTVEG